ncbi:DAK2 domain-containing protein [Conexibacter sp. CPCC 206217]|uniref:DAK2 domain-containing protein n=1 Tax=Conexibacter sp. CPCC 206217 TaxID=3064574 RepID=UPI0027206684|nr:DAK2 domain-containing protein [Conexibacter sp. CPCC 206217]MDO8211156.1 DAK2 domain-containing protein [Conexibacter sp. CPCC 206217]
MSSTAVLDADRARAWVEAFLTAVDAERLALGELDRQAGDGDYGSNLQTAVARIREALGEASASVAEPFAAVSSGFMQTGGTSGPLFGMYFRAFARAGRDAAAASGDAAGATLDVAALATAAQGGVDAVMRLGRAKLGDKTMVDAMVPAAQALQAAADSGAALADALASAGAAARGGAEETADLVARRGRASYVGDVARGVIDPGAVTVALLFECYPVA